MKEPLTKLLETGYQHLQEDRYSEALQDLSEASQLDASNAKLHFDLA